MTTAQSPLQRYKDIQALLTFKEPQDVEANELKWQSFLKVRHESYPASSPQTKEITPEPDSSPSPKFLALLELPVKDTNSEGTIELRLQKVLASDFSQATLQAQFCKELDILVSTGKILEDQCPKEEYQYLRFIEDMLSLSAFYLSFTHLETNGSEFAGVLKQALWTAHEHDLPLLAIRLLSLTLSLYHTSPSSPTASHSLYHADLYEKAGVIFQEAGQEEVGERYFGVAKYMWECLGMDEGGI